MTIDGTFNLAASENWKQSQTRRVNLEADTSSAPVTLNLPEIADVEALGGSSVEIVVNDLSANAGANNITIVPGGSDTIDGAANLVISANSGTAVLIVANGTTWAEL
jgi:hypothetical protein